MQNFETDDVQSDSIMVSYKTTKGIFIIAVLAMIVAICLAVIVPITMSQKLCHNPNENLAGTQATTVVTTRSTPSTSAPTTKKPTIPATTIPPTKQATIQATTKTPTTPPSSCPAVNATDRVDCYPDFYQSSEQTCRARGCCWAATNLPNAPYCFYPQNFQSFYVSNTVAKSYGKTLTLTRSTATPNQYGSRITTLTADIQYQTNERLRIKVTDLK